MKDGKCPTCGRGLRRSVEQNARMWAMLHELESLNWHGQKLSAYEWKDVLTAALRKQRLVPGVDGGFVAVGVHTSQLTRQEMSDLMELIAAFGAEHGVEFREAA